MSFLDLLENILSGTEVERKKSTRRSSGGSSRHKGFKKLDKLPPKSSGGGIGDVMESVVQIVAMREGFIGGMTSAWTGSGTIVHPQGVILTNCHVAHPRAMGMSSPPADRLGIAITERSDAPPALTYFADVVAYSAELDLAVIRIFADIKGRRVSNLNLPAVPIGDSDKLDLGDKLSIFGYPGIGGETVTFTSGNVSGFSSEKGVRSNRAWVKTDATIAGGNSGGTGVNQSGELVGIPTQAAAGAGVTPVDARPVLDTNRDGRIDQRDTPMAVGGFINGLRPVNLAIPLLEKAGMDIAKHRGRRASSELPQHKPQSRGFNFERSPEKSQFSELLFSNSITEDGRPIHPTTHIQEGIETVYATFEYSGMKHGTPWVAVWTTDGQEIIRQEDTWDDGSEGRKAIKISNRKGVPAGEYHLVLGIEKEIALEGKMMVGTPVDTSDSEVSGQLVDSSTGRGVSDGIVIVLKPKAPMQEFLETRDPRYVQSSTETNPDGSFKLPTQLPKGFAYSLIAAAKGFEPITVEAALRIGPGAPEKANIGNIELERV